MTTVVGSYPQPDWLIDRERLGERLQPRVRARELWLVSDTTHGKLEATVAGARLVREDLGL